MRILLGSLLVLSLTLAWTPVSATEEAVCEGLTDGGFEDGRPNSVWSETSSGLPIISQSNLHSRSGTWLAWFGGQLFEPLTQSIEQTLTIPNGHAEISYYLKIPEASTDEADFLIVSIDETQLAYFSIEDAIFLRDSYQKFTHNLIEFADGASHTIRFESYVSGSPITSFLVDDVSVDLCATPKGEELFLFTNQWRNEGYRVEDLLERIHELKEVKCVNKKSESVLGVANEFTTPSIIGAGNPHPKTNYFPPDF